MLRPSLLHRVFQWQPGSVPAWVASCNSCTGFDVLVVIEVALVIAAIWMWRVAVLPSTALASMLLVFGMFVHIPFESVERFARARRRRGECVTCGDKLQWEEAGRCENCDK